LLLQQAILFPVFAQAKEAAKRTVCLSNAKQAGLAFVMYCGDADDMSPTVAEYYNFDVAGNYSMNDTWQLVQPYAKNKQMFVCPDDQFKGCDALSGMPASAPNGGCISYGSNWGPMQSFNSGTTEGGLFGPPTGWTWSTTGPNGGYYTYAIPGISMTTVNQPSNMFAMGESADTPFYTMCMGCILSRYYYSGITLSANSQLRHGGKFQINYVDGHAKMLPFVGGIWTGQSAWPAYNTGSTAPIALPASSAHYGDWCTDPTVNIITDVGPMACNQVAPLILTQTTLWAN
jgi:prepilin-type processing-associated H-X9-DG protein